MDNKRIERIKEMERLYDEACEVVTAYSAAFERFLDIQDAIMKLEDYYASDWREDFEADENGELPPDLKRGVLSEDGLYDLLEENDLDWSFIKAPDEPSEEDEG